MLKNYSRFTIDDEDADGQSLKMGKDYFCQIVIQGANQTGATLKFLAKQLITDPDSAAVLTVAGAAMTTTIGTNSLSATFVIAGSDTESLESGLSLIYGIQRSIGTQDVVVEEGKLKIEASVIE